MKYSEFIPVKLDEGVYTFAIPVKPCPSCGTAMLSPELSKDATFWNQAKAAGIRRGFDYQRIDGKNVCEVCYDQFVQEKFECDHCNQVWPKAEIQFEYKSNGVGYLCKNCYKTITAEQWDRAIEEIKVIYSYSD